MIVKAKCIDCWEDLGDYETLFQIPKEIKQQIRKHMNQNHSVQEVRCD